MLNRKISGPHLFRILITALVLGLLFYSGGFIQITESAGLNSLLIMSAIILIPITAFIHIPFRRIQVVHAIPQAPIAGWIVPKRTLYRGHTLIAINLGGAILPLIYSVTLYLLFPVTITSFLFVISISTLSSYLLSRPIPGFGIGMPIFSTPIITALATHYIANEHVISTAYIAGTFGVIIGADVLRFNDIKKLESSFVSIGGAGIMDSIVLTGFISVLFVSLL